MTASLITVLLENRGDLGLGTPRSLYISSFSFAADCYQWWCQELTLFFLVAIQLGNKSFCKYCGMSEIGFDHRTLWVAKSMLFATLSRFVIKTVIKLSSHVNALTAHICMYAGFNFAKWICELLLSIRIYLTNNINIITC